MTKYVKLFFYKKKLSPLMLKKVGDVRVIADEVL